MSNHSMIALWVVFSGALTYALTALLRIYALNKNMVDIPNMRSSHTKVIPRGGGISIVIIYLIAVSMMYLFNSMPFDLFMALVVGGILVAGIGFVDDHGHISAIWRILIHLGAAVWALLWLGGFPESNVIGYNITLGTLGYLAGPILIGWMLNLFNFMDGIDGIASTEVICLTGCGSFVLIWFGEYTSAFWLIFLAVICLGFLIWNWPPARIFMGDAGSGFLGFTIGVFMIYMAREGMIPIWSWLTLYGVFFIDSTVTLIRRFFRGKKIYEAHRSHAYQYAARKYHSHKIVTISVLLINLFWLFPLAFLGSVYKDWSFIFMIVAFAPLVILALYFRAGIDDAGLSVA